MSWIFDTPIANAIREMMNRKEIDPEEERKYQKEQEKKQNKIRMKGNLSRTARKKLKQ